MSYQILKLFIKLLKQKKNIIGRGKLMSTILIYFPFANKQIHDISRLKRKL